MPPKRKYKASTKPPPATPKPKPQAAGGIRTSSIKRRKASVQGLKTSTSRLQPSEPLHMTTRGAARAASNHTSPAAPSSADGSSRRSSLNSVAQFQSDHDDIEDERPAKRRRVSTESGSPPNPMGSLVSQIPAVEPGTNPASRATSNTSKSSGISGKRRRASGDSSETSKTVSARPNGVFTRSESDLSEKQPRRKRRRTGDKIEQPAEIPPELTDASTPAGSPEAIPELDDSQGLQHALPTINGDVSGKAPKRLPGRRRQPHSDINVETDLRRQLSLKMGYRSIAKIQKVMLEELSKRTTTNLENDPKFHEEGLEYQHMTAALDARLQSRLAQLGAERREKLDQLERVRMAEAHIAREQYINRFKELQDDYVLQIFFRMKQMERQVRSETENATDDEDNIIQPTHMDFPADGIDARLESKYASRSRAYVETERMLNEDEVRISLDKMRKQFMVENEDHDDSVSEVNGGFATFAGPDRTEALAHHQIASLLEAAQQIESTAQQQLPQAASQLPKVELPQVIPNEQAEALLLLASLSAEAQSHTVVGQQQDHIVPPPQAATPAQQVELQRHVSPFELLSTASTAMSLETAQGTPSRTRNVEGDAQATPRATIASINGDIEITQNGTPSRISTHRVMDMLTEDQDVRVPRPRETRSPIDLEASSASYTQREERPLQDPVPPRNAPPQSDAIVTYGERQQQQQQQPKSTEEPPQTLGRTPPGFWDPRPPRPMGHGDRRTPLLRIRRMLDLRSERHRMQEQAEAAARERQEAAINRRDSIDRPQMAPPPSRPYSPHDRPASEKEARRSSAGAFNASPSTGSLQYERSPRDHPASYPRPRQNSHDQSPRSQWDSHRRTSGSQGPQASPTQYTKSPAQSHASDFGRPSPTPPPRQSPYQAPSAPPPPSVSQPQQHPLPPKPPAPPSQTPINFRFAHYDPPKAPFHTSTNFPPSQPSPQPPPPPSHYPQPYQAPAPYAGYVPPPGSFQAPPPPPTASTPYPPLKIHQYGGQPILPASMAPPSPYSQGPVSQYAQPPLHPPPHVGHPPAYGPPPGPLGPPMHQGPPPGPPLGPPPGPPPGPPLGPPVGPPLGHPHGPHPPPSYEQQPGQSPQSQERPPRRPYRSYHAPGTEFRTYQGPASRRRGG
ncbi:hypothetical protein K491DRAFT_701411 [Lophiostoma macrostomum CBS 122681]|uniref:Uncharacterized protein n=1 Tax=Lophiostoma macrostomum CBS 122681 TaxID=1314788 RepID=A0A6A6TPI9_9PLEO|nr:hypothetical protein K491DRAFT_701411 [Lophiostoma macrostomum CBS 122681]